MGARKMEKKWERNIEIKRERKRKARLGRRRESGEDKRIRAVP